MSGCRILYCHCAYSKVISEQTKTEVLRRLAASGTSFETVADLCEMAAHDDPSLPRLARGDGELRIAACYPRAVRWLFSAAGAPLDEERTSVRNMREESPETTVGALLAPVEATGTDDADDSAKGEAS